MLWVTKVFNPGPQRIGRITSNFVLPRSVALPNMIAGAVGGAFGLAGGLLMLPMLLQLDPFTSAITGAGLGGGCGVLLVTLKPWQGEHVHRVAAVHATALTSTKTMTCPGSGLPAMYADDMGTLSCPECGRAHSSADMITPRHEWRRRVYLGVMPVQTPQTGEVKLVPGSIPVTEHDI